MEQVLRESDQGVLIYVAPTKALVSQIAAEVYARFNKDFKTSGSTSYISMHEPNLLMSIIQRPVAASIPGTIVSMIPKIVRS